VRRVVVPAVTPSATRNVDVQLWYPADPADAANRPKTIYTSTLHGRQLPAPWAPLSWTVAAELAHEGAAIDPRGGAFPVVVFTHGNVNDPSDYAHTLEEIAAAGFVVAAPAHANNTQDDVRTDFVNAQANSAFACLSGMGAPCSKSDVPTSMADRVHDISKVLATLPDWFGDRVDTDRAGVLGHSRGTVTALAAAGGSAAPTSDATCQTTGDLCWPLERDGRVRAIMGMAIAVPTITRGGGLSNATVPTLLVAGRLDETSPPWLIVYTRFDPRRHSPADRRRIS
jgi:predicted dienelactone hydrolase